MLTFQVETYDGGCYQLPMLLRWDLELTGGVPCDSLSVTCLYDKGMAGVLPRATRFTAAWGGETMLRGVVDAYEISMSERGLLATVEGRGMAALLLDNESEAVTYESSQWKALQGFTRRFGGFDPYFTREGTLMVEPLWGSGKTLQVDDGTPLVSLQKREQRYGVISEVLIQDKVQGISHSVENAAFKAAGGQRRHVLYMPRSTADSRRYTGQYQIAQSALEQVEIVLVLPRAFAAFPGDRVSLGCGKLGLAGSYEVVSARSRLDEDGERTEIVLSVR